MLQTIIRIIDECADVSGLLNELDNCVDEKQMILIAHKIVIKRSEFNWLKVKINEAAKKESKPNTDGGSAEDGDKGK